MTNKLALIIAVLWFVPLPQKFEVASVKPCERSSMPPTPGQRGGGSGGRNFTVSPGRLVVNCMTLSDLIWIAYRPVMPGLGNQIGNADSRLRGGPDWVRSERYQIEARADGNPDRSITTGPMLRALLEDRFQLQLHEASEEKPIYALSIAKGGLKL